MSAAVQPVVRHDNDASLTRRTPVKCVPFLVAFFLLYKLHMGWLSKLLLLVLMILMPGGLIVAALAWFAERLRKQRLLAAAPSIHV